MAKISYVCPLSAVKCGLIGGLRSAVQKSMWNREADQNNRRGAPGGKLKMTLGLPVYVKSNLPVLQISIPREIWKEED